MLKRFGACVRSQSVGFLALFVALGGSALAAGGVLPANSVGTAQLKNRAVTGPKVARHTLTGANINFSRLGTVPNAARLGGVRPSGWQHRVGSCASGEAIQAVGQDGTPSCQTFAQGSIYRKFTTLSKGGTDTAFGGPLLLTFSCDSNGDTKVSVNTVGTQGFWWSRAGGQVSALLGLSGDLTPYESSPDLITAQWAGTSAGVPETWTMVIATEPGNVCKFSAQAIVGYN